MTKHKRRESIKSLFGSHIDPERDEQMKGTKIEIEDKVKHILKLIKDEDPDEGDGSPNRNSKKEPLVELIEDFHKQYQLLYEHYDHLKAELREKVHGKQDKESSSSSSDSDSDNASKDKGSKKGELEIESQNMKNEIKQELETANLQIADLKRKLTATIEEQAAQNFKFFIDSSKIQDAEKTITDLKAEVEMSEVENSKLLVENEELKQKLKIAGKMEAELNQRFKDVNIEKDSLIVEKGTALSRIEEERKIIEDLKIMSDQLKEENATQGLELEAVRGEVSKMKQLLEQAEQQANLEASTKIHEAEKVISDLKNEVERSGDEKSKLLVEIEELKQKQLDIIGKMEAELNQRVEDMNIEKDILLVEKQTAMRKIEDGKKIRDGLKLMADHLTDENATLKQDLEALRWEATDMELLLERAEEKVKLESLKASNKIQKADAEKSQLLVEIGELKQKLDAEVNHRLEDMNIQKDSLIMEKETAMKRIEEGEKNKEDLKIMLERLKDENSTQGLELEAARVEVSKMNLEYLTSSRKIQEADKVISDLKIEVKSSDDEKFKLFVEIGELKQKLDTGGKIEAELKQKLEDINVEKDSLIVEKETTMKKIEDGEKIIDELKTTVDQHKDENATLGLELEAVRGEVSKLKRRLENSKLQVTDLCNTLKATKDAKDSQASKISEIWNDIDKAQIVIQELMAETCQLKERSGVKERELLDLTAFHQAHKNKSSNLIKGLQEQVTSLELELESLKTQKGDMEVQIESKTTEAEHVGAENLVVKARIKELEPLFKDMGTEISAMHKKLEDNENTSLQRITDLTTQACDLLREVDSLRTQKSELEEQIVRNKDDASIQVKGLTDQVNVLQLELESLKSQNVEMNLQIEKQKENLEKQVEMLEKMGKEKDEGLLDLGEEKREAIRQLCLWIDYQRDRNEYLKEILASRLPI